MSAALLLEDVAVARGGLPVLEHLSFALPAGQALVLRGPNGIGKTTLLRAIAGLQPHLAGRITMAPDSLAYAGHADGVKPALSVAENLHFWAEIFGQTTIAPAIEAMNLSALSDRPAAALSAGQKRRLGLARLLVTGRPLWLLDEPTVSLDAESVALFARAVAAHLAAGGAALLATHIELGLSESRLLDLTPFRARPPAEGGLASAFDEAFA